MKMEIEISVLVKTDYESLKKELESKGFEIKEEYTVDDIYMLNNNIDTTKLSRLEILSNCVLVRRVIDQSGDVVELLYKYKKYNENGDILEQGKVPCPVLDKEKAIRFMEAINYKKLIHIYDKCIVFANGESELIVQLVNDKYIFIEMENHPDYIDRKYESVEELENDLNRYNLPIDNSNYFVKKAELILEEETQL